MYAADTDTLEIAFDHRAPVAEVKDGPDEDFLLHFEAHGRAPIETRS